ncbi:hypothetical protein SNEBB_002840 [Seison nebaliae]|nr:hypothetical protein SNEBB_002840 [Seison nebaliae]
MPSINLRPGPLFRRSRLSFRRSSRSSSPKKRYNDKIHEVGKFSIGNATTTEVYLLSLSSKNRLKGFRTVNKIQEKARLYCEDPYRLSNPHMYFDRYENFIGCQNQTRRLPDPNRHLRAFSSKKRKDIDSHSIRPKTATTYSTKRTIDNFPSKSAVYPTVLTVKEANNEFLNNVLPPELSQSINFNKWNEKTDKAKFIMSYWPYIETLNDDVHEKMMKRRNKISRPVTALPNAKARKSSAKLPKPKIVLSNEMNLLVKKIDRTDSRNRSRTDKPKLENIQVTTFVDDVLKNVNEIVYHNNHEIASCYVEEIFEDIRINSKDRLGARFSNISIELNE